MLFFPLVFWVYSTRFTRRENKKKLLSCWTIPIKLYWNINFGCLGIVPHLGTSQGTTVGNGQGWVRSLSFRGLKKDEIQNMAREVEMHSHKD